MSGLQFGLLAGCAAAEGDQEDGALAASVGREEVDDIIVIKSQAACAQVLSVRGEVEFTAQNSGSS